MTLRITCPHCGQKNVVEKIKTEHDGDGRLAIDLGYCKHCQRLLGEADESKPPMEQQAEARKLMRERARLVQGYNTLTRQGATAADLVAWRGEIDGMGRRLTELGL